jgi:hypothetical protein
MTSFKGAIMALLIFPVPLCTYLMRQFVCGKALWQEDDRRPK